MNISTRTNATALPDKPDHVNPQLHRRLVDGDVTARCSRYDALHLDTDHGDCPRDHERDYNLRRFASA